ncbi:MAG: HAD-IA family hydrolase [Candidatus Diapherotrites archaeon]|nr:HAD-IA family hydrolase [Candidatus Micrarchaeota archaeon]MBU1939272.1 HAD-IA family hydrolase [Candidatus Micrarchaeota archaeon]
MDLQNVLKITVRKAVLTVILLTFMFFGEFVIFDTLGAMAGSVVFTYVFVCLLVYVYDTLLGKTGIRVIAFDMGGVYMAGDYYTEEVQPREGFPELVRKLRANYRVIVLSNQNAEAHALFEEKFGLNEVFDDQIVSGRVGLKKPDPRLFMHVANRFGVAMGQIVFVDDMQEFLAPAKKMGVKTIHFRGMPRLEAELSRLKVVF